MTSLVWVKVAVFWLEKAGLPETIVPSAERIGTSTANDNMIQQRDIHCRRRLSELPSELYVRRARTWVTTWMVMSTDHGGSCFPYRRAEHLARMGKGGR